MLRKNKMPVELEIKLKVEDFAPIRERLQSARATRQGERLETNILFDTPERKLVNTGQGLRLRHQKDLATNAEELILTFKGPRSQGPLKSREEIELKVDNLEAAKQFLAHLGYKPFLSFEKRRETWKLNNCLIELDTLPQLGTYLEIEGPSEQNINAIRAQLALTNNPAVIATYPQLVSNHVPDQGNTQKSLNFE